MRTHGKSGTKIHYIWIEMRRRCKNPIHPKFHLYGGRGIKVCDEWESFETFFEWSISAGYKPGLSIDRKDNDSNYTPLNCRWVTQGVQNNNTRRTNKYIFQGKKQSLADWARELDLNYYTLRSRARIGWAIDKILTTPMEANGHDRNKLSQERKFRKSIHG